MKIRKIFSVMLAFIVTIIFLFSSISIQLFAVSTEDSISERLQEAMSATNSEAKIPVQIFLKDSIDYSFIEDQAMKLANITKQEIAYIETPLYSQSLNNFFCICETEYSVAS